MKEIFKFREDKTQPSWLTQLRRRAIERFDRLGFPTTRSEEWRYTSVEPLMELPFGIEGVEGTRIEGNNLPKGVIAGHFNDSPQIRELAEPYLGRTADFESRPFVALNTAFIKDGVVISIPKGTIASNPITIEHDASAVSHPRNLIVAEEGSQATIVEIYRGGGEKPTLSNSVTEIVCGEGSTIDYYRLQQEGSFHIGSVDVHQDRQSRFSSLVLSLGGILSRTEVRTILDAEGAECELNGLYMVGGTEHVDNQTSIDHAKPHSTSREMYKGILDGSSRGVFNGRILVRPDAQKTNARQTNRNLILSDQALMNSKPLLEIFANDVKCNHGATIGRLDENQLFYLRSRGLGALQAKSLLTYAFASDLIGKIKIPSLREAMEKMIFRRLLAGETSGSLS